MIYKPIPRNEPIATLIKWYNDKKSGKVSYARQRIQKRFYYLDWKDQKRIILAFLNSTKGDREWALKKIYQQWDDSYFEPVKALWEKYHESTCTWPINQYFPIEFIKENAKKLEEVGGYYHLCLRLAEDPAYIINRSKLQDEEYLLVMLNTHRAVHEEEAKKIFYRAVVEFCLMELNYRSFHKIFQHNRGGSFSVFDIVEIESIRHIYYLLGFHDLIQSLEEWNTSVMTAMKQGEELEALNREALKDEDYYKKRIAIGQKYLYLAIDEKYKQPIFNNVKQLECNCKPDNFMEGLSLDREDECPF